MAMSNYKYLFLIGFFFLTVGSLEAQNRRNNKKDKEVDKYFNETGGFVNQLWYGGNLNLGFSGTQGVSQFSFGLTPMVGYKILPFLSVGPRIGFNYTNLKGETQNTNGQLSGRKSVNLNDYSVGIFSRVKFLRVMFVHLELTSLSQEQAFVTGNGFLATDANNNNKIITERSSQLGSYAGLGYNNGMGGIGYEILALYNFNITKDDPRSPFELRIGFTYKF